MNYKLITSENIWMEDKAVQQLETVARLKGVIDAVGYQDLHPGRGIPVGVSIITNNIIYPHLIGNDIGCGMALFETGKAAHKLKIDRLVKRLEDKRSLDTVEVTSELQDTASCISASYIPGSIGKGNHFVELQKICEIKNQQLFEETGLDKKSALILVHSGSRGYGQEILRFFIDKYQAQKGLEKESMAGKEYLLKHQGALEWARINRHIVAKKFYRTLGFDGELTLRCDHVHNYVETQGDVVIHRKGANSAGENLLVIPGSRGSYTYLARPLANSSKSGYSVPHGAGRKWDRQRCRARLDGKYTKHTIKKNSLGNTAVCKDYTLLFEEAAEAYKNIGSIMADLEKKGMVEIVAVLQPLLTFKE